MYSSHNHYGSWRLLNNKLWVVYVACTEDAWAHFLQDSLHTLGENKTGVSQYLKVCSQAKWTTCVSNSSLGALTLCSCSPDCCWCYFTLFIFFTVGCQIITRECNYHLLWDTVGNSWEPPTPTAILSIAQWFRKIKRLLIRKQPSTQPEAQGNVGTMQAAEEGNTDQHKTLKKNNSHLKKDIQQLEVEYGEVWEQSSSYDACWQFPRGKKELNTSLWLCSCAIMQCKGN